MEMSKTNKLIQEIEEYLAKDYCCDFKEECKDGVRIRCSAYEVKLDLIFRFAEPKEKRIAELEQQIEKMKCCENCAWWYKLPNGQIVCAKTCENLDNWSFRKP